MELLIILLILLPLLMLIFALCDPFNITDRQRRQWADRAAWEYREREAAIRFQRLRQIELGTIPDWLVQPIRRPK